MKRNAGLALCLLNLAPIWPAEPSLAARLDALIANPKVSRATWGIQIVELGRGRVLYQRNPANLLAPASNAKLFSTALALARLGPGHRFETFVRSKTAPDASGVLLGNLEFIGGGDPSLSGRVLPFDKDAAAGDPMAAIEALAESIVQSGVRRIEGNVVGDDTAYPWEPFPEGWTIEDSVWTYGAPVGALVANDNTISLRMAAGRGIGDAAQLSFSPGLEHFAVHNRIETTAASGALRIQIDRLPDSSELHLWGTIPISSKGFEQSLSAGDPARFAAALLYDALLRRGVTISGEPVARHRRIYERLPEHGAVELARRQSPPLDQIIQVVNKVSQNLHAEILLREVARIRRGDGALKTSLAELIGFLKQIGLAANEHNIWDGSGLSRQTKLAPAALVKLLAYMDRPSPYRQAWIDSLPIGGVDGTLRLRFQQNEASRSAGLRIAAKTGTLGYSRTLSGYVTSKSKGRLAFAVMVNNFTESAEVREIIDKIGVILSE